VIPISSAFLRRQFPDLPKGDADTARDLLRRLAHPYYAWPVDWRYEKGRGVHYSHLLRPIFERDIAKHLPGLLDTCDTAFDADGCVFENRARGLIDCRPVVNTGDTHTSTVWLVFGKGAYWTCLGDLVEYMERRHYRVNDNNDDLLRL